eukprot:2897033-Rhodomonas_salina.4
MALSTYAPSQCRKHAHRALSRSTARAKGDRARSSLQSRQAPVLLTLHKNRPTAHKRARSHTRCQQFPRHPCPPQSIA